jgi:hypothetical protein
MAQTDPLGLDEGHLFGLRHNPREGDGPIIPGPGDTYVPPRQWIDGEELSGENIVLWHVPLLFTKKSEPWWCMPDPEPDFSPCEAILSAVPAGELPPPGAQPVAPVAPSDDGTPEAPTPAPVVPTPTPRPIEGSTPEEIIQNAGCASCHQVGELGEGHKVGPDLSNIGALAAHRVPGLPPAAYIRQSIMEPNALISPVCPNGPCMGNIMPGNYSERLTGEQVEGLVAFLLQQTEPLQVEESAGGQKEAEPAAKAVPAQQPVGQRVLRMLATSLPLQILILSVVFLVSLLIYVRGNNNAKE